MKRLAAVLGLSIGTLKQRSGWTDAQRAALLLQYGLPNTVVQAFQ